LISALAAATDSFIQQEGEIHSWNHAETERPSLRLRVARLVFICQEHYST
jgi:hypothetical protein